MEIKATDLEKSGQRITIVPQKNRYYEYQTSQEKWDTISNIFSVKIPSFIKNHQKFIRQSFTNQQKDLEEVFGNPDSYFGFKNEGIGIKFNNALIQQVGYYDLNNGLYGIGKKLISREKKVKQVGIYHKPDSLTRYLDNEKPPKVKKLIRDHLRESIKFQNRFVNMKPVEAVQKNFKDIVENMKENTNNRIAQQLIQHLDEVSIQPNDQFVHINNNQTLKTKNKQDSFQRRQREKTRMMDDVSLERIKQQLDRSKSYKKKDRSGLKNLNLTPAELKYTSKKLQPVNADQNKKLNGKNRNDFNYKPNDEENERPRYENPRRILNFEDQNPEIRYENKHGYPKYAEEGQENGRKYEQRRHNITPKKVDQKYRQFQYLDEKDPPPIQVYQPNIPKKDSFSPTKWNKDQYNKYDRKNWADKYSNEYDSVYKKDQKPDEREQKYTLNKGRGYQFNDDPSFNKLMGYRNDQPERTSKSPIRNGSPQQHKKRKYGDTSGSIYPKQYQRTNRRQTEQNGYSPYSRRKIENVEKKTGYGYFNKNR